MWGIMGKENMIPFTVGFTSDATSFSLSDVGGDSTKVGRLRRGIVEVKGTIHKRIRKGLPGWCLRTKMWSWSPTYL